jgi:hypothetical protein
MKRISCCLIFILTFFTATFGVCGANAAPLRLMISKTIDKNKSTIVEVKIKNVGEQYVAFENVIFYQDNSGVGTMPLSELRFYIDKGKGYERLIYPPDAFFPNFEPADPKNFFILGPNYLWGLEIDLETKFQINFPKGNYEIKAVFENRSRSWMYKHYNKEKISQMHINEKNIFDGMIESNSLNIEIGK